MIAREKWRALAEKCEKASAPDYRIAAEIFMALRPAVDHPPHWTVLSDTGAIWAWNSPPPNARGTGGVYRGPVDYMHSVDAVTAVINERLPGAMIGSFHAAGHHLPAYSQIAIGNDRPMVLGSGKTEAIARCAAFCRAMAAISAE